jgi:hypothetical protein
MASYEENVEFINAIIAVGTAINQLEAAFDLLAPYLTEYFYKREHYLQPEVREWIISKLSLALPEPQRLLLQQYSEFKGQHNLTAEQKNIRDNAQPIRAKLLRWYNKIGNMQYGIQLPTIPPTTPETPVLRTPGKY